MGLKCDEFSHFWWSIPTTGSSIFVHWLMGNSRKWPDLRSHISKIRNKRFVRTDDLIIFRTFQSIHSNTFASINKFALARLLSFCTVGSLDLTWWPDLAWPRIETFTKVAEKMADQVGENLAALRPAVFLLSAKNRTEIVLRHAPSRLSQNNNPQQGEG